MMENFFEQAHMPHDELDVDSILTANETAALDPALPLKVPLPDGDGRIRLGYLLDESGDGVCFFQIEPMAGGYGLMVSSYSVNDGKLSPNNEGNASAIWGRPGVSGKVLPDAQAAYDLFREYIYGCPEVERFDSAVMLLRVRMHGLLDGYPEDAPFSKFRDCFSDACLINEADGVFDCPPLANAMLILRYPFIAYWKGNGDHKEPDLTWTNFDVIPVGWRIAFGLELLEDIRNELYCEDPLAWKYRLCRTYIQQIKEKYGTLRVYMTSWGRVGDIIEAYEVVSRTTCIQCGRADRTRINTRGWVSPYCPEHIPDIDRGISQKTFSEKLREAGAPEERVKELSLRFAGISMSAPANASMELEDMMSDWPMFKFLPGEGMETEFYNRAKGLLDGTCAGNGQPRHIRNVLERTIAQIQDLEAECREIEQEPFFQKFRMSYPELEFAWFSEKEKTFPPFV